MVNVKSVEDRIVVRTKDWEELLKQLGSRQVTYVTSTRQGYIYANTYDAERLGEHIVH